MDIHKERADVCRVQPPTVLIYYWYFCCTYAYTYAVITYACNDFRGVIHSVSMIFNDVGRYSLSWTFHSIYIYIQSHNISDVWVVYRKICIRMVYLKFDMYCLHQHHPHARGRPLPSGGWVQQRGKPFWWYGSYGSGWPVFNTWGNMGNLSGTVCIYNVCTN